MVEQPLPQQKSGIQIAYEACCQSQANTQSKVVTKSGNIDGAYTEFHASLGTLYNHTITSGGTVSEIRTGDGLLLDTVLNWLEIPCRSIATKKGRRHYTDGVKLFRQLSAALAKTGVLR